jgi:DeoR/GlpR family transcriptional regulator of sugar metabolism
MPTRKIQDRFEQILDALRLTPGSSIHALAEQLEVSEMTVRRDLETLAEEGRVRLVHAGAVASGEEADPGRTGYSLAGSGS